MKFCVCVCHQKGFFFSSPFCLKIENLLTAIIVLTFSNFNDKSDSISPGVDLLAKNVQFPALCANSEESKPAAPLWSPGNSPVSNLLKTIITFQSQNDKTHFFTFSAFRIVRVDSKLNFENGLVSTTLLVTFFRFKLVLIPTIWHVIDKLRKLIRTKMRTYTVHGWPIFDHVLACFKVKTYLRVFLIFYGETAGFGGRSVP